MGECKDIQKTVHTYKRLQTRPPVRLQPTASIAANRKEVRIFAYIQSIRKLMPYNLLKGKRGLIFGALNDKSIAWKVAERAREEGADWY